MKKSYRDKIIKAYHTLHDDKQLTFVVTKSELKEAFQSYENFKAFILNKFGIDITYLDYLEELYKDEE